MRLAEIDVAVVERALKVAGLVVVKMNGSPSAFPLLDLAQALRVVVSEKAEELKYGTKSINEDLARRLLGIDYAKPGSDRTFVQYIRVGPAIEPTWAAERAADAAVQAKEGYGCMPPDCDGPNAKPPEPVVVDDHEHHRFEDDGGPPAKKEWDDHPKVGYAGEDREALARGVRLAMGWKE